MKCPRCQIESIEEVKNKIKCSECSYERTADGTVSFVVANKYSVTVSKGQTHIFQFLRHQELGTDKESSVPDIYINAEVKPNISEKSIRLYFTFN